MDAEVGKPISMSYKFFKKTAKSPPPWWFNGVPQYRQFSPGQLAIDMDTVVLLRVGCQCCDHKFEVACGSPSLREPQLIDPESGRIESYFYDDPPWHLSEDGYNCGGSTMGMEPLIILEVWTQISAGKWKRQSELEGIGNGFGSSRA